MQFSDEEMIFIIKNRRYSFPLWGNMSEALRAEFCPRKDISPIFIIENHDADENKYFRTMSSYKYFISSAISSWVVAQSVASLITVCVSSSFSQKPYLTCSDSS